jgi:hypothetical protein
MLIIVNPIAEERNVYRVQNTSTEAIKNVVLPASNLFGCAIIRCQISGRKLFNAASPTPKVIPSRRQ